MTREPMTPTIDELMADTNNSPEEREALDLLFRATLAEVAERQAKALRDMRGRGERIVTRHDYDNA